MSESKFEKWAKNEPHGEELIADQKEFKEKLDEFDKKLTHFVFWLTGLSAGQVAFIIANLDTIFKIKDYLFIITTCLLLLCIFSGLLFHFFRIVYVYFDKEFSRYRRLISMNLFARENQEISLEIREKNKEYYEEMEGIPKKWSAVELCIKIFGILNMVTYFMGSFFLVILASFKLFQN